MMMTSDTPECSLDTEKLQFLQLRDGAESLKFFNHFFEIVEELKLRRITEGEYEDKINCLIKEKHQLNCDFETMKLKLKTLEEDQELRAVEMSRNYESQLSEAQRHCARQDVSLEVALNEMKTLREEVRDLQFLKHSFEKRSRDQERKIQQQNGILENSFKQLKELDSHFQEVCSKVCSLEEEHSKLGSSVRDVIKANVDFAKVLEHQQNLLAAHKEEIKRLKENNMRTNAKFHIDNWSESYARTPVNDITVTLKFELEASKQVNSILKEKLKLAEENYQRTVKLLSDSQSIISHHITTNDKLMLENSVLQISISENHGKNQQKVQEELPFCPVNNYDEHLDENGNADKLHAATKVISQILTYENLENQEHISKTFETVFDHPTGSFDAFVLPPAGDVQNCQTESEIPKYDDDLGCALEPTTENLEIMNAVSVMAREFSSPDA